MNKELNLIDIWTKNWIWYLFNCTHSLRSFVWCDMNNCIQRTEFVVHINQFSHLTSDLYSWMLFLDTETRLDWIQITSTWKRTWIQFQFTGGAFLCQIDIWTKNWLDISNLIYFIFDTETRLDWIQITSTWKRTWIEFEFTGGMFLCQETTFMNANQKSNVKIDWYEQQIRFSECSCSYHITQMSEANECN